MNTPQTKIAIDTELWTRFFDLAELYHVECVIGGFRFWGENRSHTQAAAMQSEIDLCLSDMMERQDDATNQIVRSIKSYRALSLPSLASPCAASLGGAIPTNARAQPLPISASSAMGMVGS